MTQELDNRIHYRVTGGLYLLLGLPGAIALFSGLLERGGGGDGYFALSGGLVPVGILFLVFGFGKPALTNLSDAAVKLSIIALKQYCAKALLAYMSPDAFQLHDALPRTATDKVDYQSLLESAPA